MDAQITLTTSDNPPVSLTISRSALVTHSKVFADMLSLNLKSEDDDKSIPLAETKKEVTPLLLVVGDQEGQREEVLSTLSEEGWETLAKLADKYDCWAVRREVEAKAWQTGSENGSAAFAFTLATLSGNDSLIRFTARRAVAVNLTDPNFRATQPWKDRLELWKTMRAAQVLTVLHQYSSSIPKVVCEAGSKCWKSQAGWHRLCGLAFAAYNVVATCPLPISRQHTPEICSSHCASLKAYAEDFEAEASNWPEFPMNWRPVGEALYFLS
ncbi:hypothetical protein JCM5353_002540 [Sporobolomyces roseus]